MMAIWKELILQTLLTEGRPLSLDQLYHRLDPEGRQFTWTSFDSFVRYVVAEAWVPLAFQRGLDSPEEAKVGIASWYMARNPIQLPPSVVLEDDHVGRGAYLDMLELEYVPLVTGDWVEQIAPQLDPEDYA